MVLHFFNITQDKESSIPHEELGRSIATVQELQRKHEIFERELTALGNKVICPSRPIQTNYKITCFLFRCPHEILTESCACAFTIKNIAKGFFMSTIGPKRCLHLLSHFVPLWLCVLLHQVRELSNESLRLSTAYPGANATVITNSMEKVQQAWDSLQAAANARKRKLRAASEFQKFLSSVSTVAMYVRMYARGH